MSRVPARVALSRDHYVCIYGIILISRKAVLAIAVLKQPVYGPRLAAGGLGHALCRPSRRGAELKAFPELFQHGYYELQYCGLARAGASGYYQRAAGKRKAYRPLLLIGKG